MNESLVTMVFTDLVSSTAMKAALPGRDGEERNRAYVDTILAPHRLRVEHRLAAEGGRVVKTMGDGYFLVFASPVRAVGWAIDVQECHETDPIPTPLGPLGVKIGIHTGAPLPDGGDFIGREVDFAARVSALASGGQIVLSEATAGLIRAENPPGVRLYPHGERDLKGIGKCPVFEVLYQDKQPGALKEGVFSPANLPPAPEPFVGRSEPIARLQEGLHAGGVTVLKGPGGIGKTALALAVAHAVHRRGDLPGGVAWLNCEVRPCLSDCLRQMAHVFFGDRMEHEHIDQCQARVYEHLSRCSALAVFDNFDSVASDGTLLQWLADVRPPARVLLTTRRDPPGLRGQVIEVGELSQAEAVELFIRRATARGVAARGQEPLIGELCAAVGNLPLAIELLSARAAGVPLPRLLERMRRSLEVLAEDDPSLPERQRSARACFGLSYGQLSERARNTLLRFSVLPDGAGCDVVTTVLETDDWDQTAQELVTNSVWQLAGERYTVQTLVRQFALEELGAERLKAEHAASVALTRLAEEKAAMTRPGSGGPEELLAVLDWFAAEWRNLLACARFAAAAEDWPVLCRLAGTVFDFWHLRGFWSDAEGLYNLAVDAARRAGDKSILGRILSHRGVVYRHQGRWAEAEAAYRESLVALREARDPAGEGQALFNLARVLQLEERWEEAEAAAQASIRKLGETGDRLSEARAINRLGEIYRYQNRLADAKVHYERSRALCVSIGAKVDEGHNLNNLGRVYQLENHLDEAEEAYRQDLAICRTYRYRDGEGMVLKNLGSLYKQRGRFEDAEAALQQSLNIRRELADRVGEGETLLNFAELRLARNDLPGAATLGRQAVAVLGSTEDRRHLGAAQEFVARCEQTKARS